VQKHKILRDAIRELEGKGYEAGKWILDEQYYKDWETNPQSILWLWAQCKYHLPMQ
jgi:hypothetical protein